MNPTSGSLNISVNIANFVNDAYEFLHDSGKIKQIVTAEYINIYNGELILQFQLILDDSEQMKKDVKQMIEDGILEPSHMAYALFGLEIQIDKEYVKKKKIEEMSFKDLKVVYSREMIAGYLLVTEEDNESNKLLKGI